MSTPQRIGKWMLIVAWLLAIALVTLLFQQWLERRANPNRDLDAGSRNGMREVRLVQDRGGHYVAPGRINGHPVRFLLDTGATEVSVPAPLAAELGLAAGPARRVRTANGFITVRATRLDRVSLGSIVVEQVAAHINPRDRGDTVLLGMSFLRSLELSQSNGVLTLHQPGAGD